MLSPPPPSKWKKLLPKVTTALPSESYKKDIRAEHDPVLHHYWGILERGQRNEHT